MKKMNDSVIICLKGPDRVRKRPAVIFNSDDAKGATCAVEMLLNIFITEAALGYSKELSVTIHKDNSICILSKDRGFVLDETLVDGKPVWEYDFCELFSAPREKKGVYSYGLIEEKNHNELYGEPDIPFPKYSATEWGSISVDLCCVQYVSEYMNVEAINNGLKKRLSFKKGYKQLELQKEETDDSSYTQICFRLDEEVFTSIDVLSDSILCILESASVTISGLKCSLIDERQAFEKTFVFPNSLIDYAKTITAKHKSTAFYTQEIETKGKDRYNKQEYDAKVKVIFGVSSVGGFTKCIHNYKTLEFGGRHLEAILDKVKDILGWRIASRTENADLDTESIIKKCFILLETNCSPKATNWENATKKAITNRMIADMCSDLFNDDFSYFIEQNKDDILSVLKENIYVDS